MASNESVKVAIRWRPLIKREGDGPLQVNSAHLELLIDSYWIWDSSRRRLLIDKRWWMQPKNNFMAQIICLLIYSVFLPFAQQYQKVNDGSFHCYHFSYKSYQLVFSFLARFTCHMSFTWLWINLGQFEPNQLESVAKISNLQYIEVL